MMQSVLSIRTVSLCAGLIMASLTGCAYGPSSYYGGYGQSPYGGYSPSPYGGTYPGGTYQGGYPAYQPGMVVPDGMGAPVNPTPYGTPPTYNNGGGLQPIPNPGGGDAPPYSSSPGANPVVPDPSQYNSSSTNFYQQNSGQGTFAPQYEPSPISPANHSQLESIPPIQAPLRSSSLGNYNDPTPPPGLSSPAQLPAMTAYPMSNGIEVNSAPSGGGQEFLPPVQQSPMDAPNDPFAAPAPSMPNIDDSPQPLPLNLNTHKFPDESSAGIFDHEPEYRWIRGVASLDEHTGIWGVTYSDVPGEKDPYAGHLSLARSPALDGLREGEIVQVSGEFDPVLKDPRGKSMYLVTSVKRVDPSTGMLTATR